jgi:hypothetical protein
MSDSSAGSSGRAATEDPVFDALVAAVQATFKTRTAVEPVHLFTTRTPELFATFVAALPAEQQAEHTCSACRRFVERFGGLVRVTEDGETTPVMWDAERVPERYAAAVRALAAAVGRAPIDGVFLTDEKKWGQAVTEGWTHFAALPAKSCVHKPSPVQTTGQARAELLHDHEVLLRGLAEFPSELVANAYSLLTTGALYRSEKCIGVAKWLLDLHERRKAAASPRARENLTWLAVAGAPAGYCHVRSTMIGALLEDLAAGLQFAAIKTRFAEKMNPLQYQRPTAPPAAGNIAQAEKIVGQLRSAGALERRFARLADITPLWLPPPVKEQPQEGVFSHLKPKEKGKQHRPVEAPPVTMTWEKFARTVLPQAEAIEYLVPRPAQFYLALVTAKHPEAPPILQWDLEERRNPVSWYVYVRGSEAKRWGLKVGEYRAVTAVTLAPPMWHGGQKFAHHGEKAIFVLDGAKDLEYVTGAGFFPEFLKSEYHPIRATLEAYAKDAAVEGSLEAEACGICLQKGQGWDHTFRVTAKGGRTTYKLDRWD